MKTEIISTQKTTDVNRQELYGLFRQFYANTNYERFLSDFSEKHWLIRMSDATRLVGFSTQQVLEIPWGNGIIRFLYSGDTIVHPDYWNKSHLAGAFGHLFLKIKAEAATPLYWFLISKGFRTYRFLPVFFKTFHPHHAGASTAMKPLLDAVATSKFKEDYTPDSGIIAFAGSKDYLIDDLSAIPPSRQTDPHVSFFKQINPTYSNGDELACIAPLHHDNLTRCGKRVIESTKVEWNV